jgi:hypothetical protein
MVGPVLYQEMLLGSRHGRWHWLRWLYAGWLLLALWCLSFLLLLEPGIRHPESLTTLSVLSGRFLQFYVAQHFVLLTLATPVFAAGAISDEKTRGTLQYLLTADLLTWELILGKLLGRIYQVLMLLSIGLPLFCFFGVFSGLGPVPLLGFMVCSFVLLFALGAASILASVWCRHTRDAVLSLYCVGVFLSILPGIVAMFIGNDDATWLERTLELPNPLLPLGPRWAVLPEGEYLGRLGLFTLYWVILGFVCLALAILRLRPAYRRQLQATGGQGRSRRWGLGRPRVGRSPISWKERHVEGIAPLAILRHIPTWLGVTAFFLLGVVVYGWLLLLGLPLDTPPDRFWDYIRTGDWSSILGVLQRINISHEVFWNKGQMMLVVAVLVVGVRCSGAVTREREKQTWEALLLTPLTTEQLIRGKLWGIAGGCVPYLAAYAVPAVVLSVIAGPGAFAWTLLWLAVVALGIWYAGAVGLWCSVRARSSWRSLLGTLLYLYVGGVVLLGVLMFFALLVALLLILLLFLFQVAFLREVVTTFTAVFGNAMLAAVCLVLGAAFFLLSWRLLVAAERRVSILERTRHWQEEPIVRYPRQSAPIWHAGDRRGRIY